MNSVNRNRPPLKTIAEVKLKSCRIYQDIRIPVGSLKDYIKLYIKQCGPDDIADGHHPSIVAIKNIAARYENNNLFLQEWDVEQLICVIKLVLEAKKYEEEYLHELVCIDMIKEFKLENFINLSSYNAAKQIESLLGLF